MSKEEITDEYVLSKDTVLATDAAKYLGMSWWALTNGLIEGRYPFGEAIKNRSGTGYTYKIYSKKLYNYKHGINEQPNIDELVCQLRTATAALVEVMNNCFSALSRT